MDSSARAPSPPGRGGTRAAPRSALASATRASSWIPMTSPVDCIPGPTDGSTPRSFAVEAAVPAQLGQRRAETDADGQLDHRHAGDLGQERDRARGAGVDLDEVDAVV